DGRANSYSGIQHMNGRRVFCIEPVERGGCAHAGNGMPAHKYVECCQAPQQVWLPRRVDPVPDADQSAILDLNVELLTSDDRRQLRGGGESAGLLEDC